MIRWKQEAMDLQDFGLELPNPDFQMLARAYGAGTLSLASSSFKTLEI